jgi:hypothetical protein
MVLQVFGADGRTRTAMDYVHHPLKMACLPISPHRLFFLLTLYLLMVNLVDLQVERL